MLNLRSSRKFNVSTAALIVSCSLLPYSDFFIDLFIDTKSISVSRFSNLSYAIWAYCTPLSTILVFTFSHIVKVPKWVYLPFIYVQISQIIAYLIMQYNIDIESDWLFRLINLAATLILFFASLKIYSWNKELLLKDQLMSEFIKTRDE